MHRVLFVCHGNICRSPMGEFLLKNMVRQAGQESQFEIASAATSREELGNDLYLPAKSILQAHHIPFTRHYARQLLAADYEKFDYFLGMDEENLRNMRCLFKGDPAQKVHLLLSFTPHPRPVADPWYTGDFAQAFFDIEEGCRAFLHTIEAQRTL